ncbi:MAG: isoprenyl transferase [Planctomycetota bacterium]|jgi:undecaprenyl diphosphate synthase
MKITEENLKKSAKRLSLQPSQMPRHIAIIMDGNGRWAQQKGLQRVAGHQKGGKTVEQIALDCVDLGIEVLTLYSFSTENWKRPKAEVDALMALYTQYLVGIRPMMMENKVKLVHLGRLTRLPENLKVALAESIEMTAKNKGMILALALNYSGRAEMVDATKKIAQKYKSGRLTLEEIDELCISRNLYTAGLPDPDLLIRTANEQRVSNFLLWQISYTEFHVTKTLWPDFRKADVEEAILDYAGRTHSFGEVKSKQ